MRKTILTLIAFIASYASSFTVPVTRKDRVKPITRSQKLLAEHFNHKLQESHNLDESSPQVKLTNLGNVAYLGPMYFTDQFQGSDLGRPPAFVYDSGSGDLTTTSADCGSSCSSHVYDFSKSTTAHRVTDTVDTLKYGSATLQGYYVEDTVCLAAEANLCVKSFKFFEITKDEGL